MSCCPTAGPLPVIRGRSLGVTVPSSAAGVHVMDTKVSVTLPVGALLNESSQPSTTLLGMAGVYWEGRHYSVYPKDLLKKAERVSTA